MNRIATLSAENVKCPLIRHDLSAINVIVGQNFSWKTARLEAIRLGLLGFVPGLPKINAGIFQLSCGPKMSVELRLTDGTKILRTFVKKNGSVNAAHTVEPVGFSVPDVLMDAGEYLRLSDRER